METSYPMFEKTSIGKNLSSVFVSCKQSMSTSFAISQSLTWSILERIEFTFHVATSKALKNYCLSYYHVNEDKNLVLNQAARFMKGRFLLTCLCLTPLVIAIGRGVFSAGMTNIAEVENYSTNDKRDIFKTFDTKDQNDQGFPIDPFDLMNRIKQAGAMRDATTPSEAIDEALNAFDESEY